MRAYILYKYFVYRFVYSYNPIQYDFENTANVTFIIQWVLCDNKIYAYKSISGSIFILYKQYGSISSRTFHLSRRNFKKKSIFTSTYCLGPRFYKQTLDQRTVKSQDIYMYRYIPIYYTCYTYIGRIWSNLVALYYRYIFDNFLRF